MSNGGEDPDDSTGSDRPIRGGGWSDGSSDLGNNSRWLGLPDDQYLDIGFRLVLRGRPGREESL